MYVEQIMTHSVKACAPDSTLGSAAQLMWEFDCGAIPVVDRQRHVVGLLTDRDICMAAYFQGSCLDDIWVAKAMSRNVIVCTPHDNLAYAEEMMRRNQVRRLPVVDFAGRLVGILSLTDIIRYLHRPSDAQNEQLNPEDVTETLADISKPRARAFLRSGI